MIQYQSLTGLIQLACGLVSEYQRRLTGQRDGKRHPLLFAPGESRGQVVGTRSKPELAKEDVGPTLGVRTARQAAGKGYVLRRTQVLEQIACLEDHSHLAAPQPSSLLLAEAGKGLAGDPGGAGAGFIESGSYL